MHKKTIIFDFDGTIANTLDAIIEIYNGMAAKFRCKELLHQDREKIRKHRPQELLKSYGITKLKLFFLLLRGRKKLHDKIADIKPIIGMPRALRKLNEAGYSLGILTSNSKKNVKIFLEANGLSDAFDFISSSKKVFKKEKTIKRIMKAKRLSMHSTIYVGDETRDIESLKKSKIPILAVSWGFNTREILMKLQPDYLLDEPHDLFKYLEDIFNVYNLNPKHVKRI